MDDSRQTRDSALRAANSRVGNWIRQRSRWIKGCYQTWLVHTRSPRQLWRDLGPRQFCAFHLTLGFSGLTGLLNPIFWALTCVYLITGPAHISALFPSATCASASSRCSSATC